MPSEGGTAQGVSDSQRGTANRFGQGDPPPQRPAAPPPKPKVVPAEPKAGPAKSPAGPAKPPAAAGPVLSAPDYIDNLAQSISIDNGAYIVHWSKGKQQYTMAVPETWVRRGPGRAGFLNTGTIYDTRQDAVAALTPLILSSARKYPVRDYVGFWRDAGIPVTAPTVFSELTTPHILAGIEAKDEDMRQAAKAAEQEVIDLAKGMLVGRFLGGAHAAAQSSFRGPVPQFRVPPAEPTNARGLPPGEQSTATTPPARGATSSTGPPAAGTQTSTVPPARGATASSRPAAPKPPAATPAQRATAPQNQGLPATPLAVPAAPPVRDAAAANRWLRTQLNIIRDNPNHRLRFLLEPNPSQGGRLDWRRTTRVTKSGRTQTGRYEGNADGPTIQIGHQAAFAGGAQEQFMIEDADLNQVSGNVIETMGATSYKDAALIDGTPVDIASALQWERLGNLPAGTVAGSPRVVAPAPPQVAGPAPPPVLTMPPLR
jgi:Bacterial toxin 5